MADLTPAGRSAMAYWGVIEFAAQEHLTTADLWTYIRDAADELGLASPGVTVRGVSELRAWAGRIQESARQFEQVRDSARLRSTLVADAPWARDLNKRGGMDVYQVRYQHTFDQDGLRITEWRTSVFTNTLPRTAGELRAAIEQDANELARKYKVDHVGTAGLQILAV